MRIQPTPLTLSYKVMTMHNSPHVKRNISHLLFDVIERTMGIDRERIKSPDRTMQIAKARHVFCYLIMRHEKGITLNEAGNLINRDHATVIYGIKKVEDLMDSYSDFKSLVRQVEYKFLMEFENKH